MSIAESQQGVVHNLLQKNNQLLSAIGGGSLPVRRNDPQAPSEKRSIAHVQEDARSVRSQRHYDKSARSGRSQEPKPDNKSVRSTSSNNEKKSVQSSHDFNKYTRLTNSNVSQPDNLVCDKCINHDAHKNKLDKLADDKAKDRDHAQRVNENAKKQLEDEKRKHLEKLKLYQDAIDNQKADLEKKKILDKQADAEEKEKIRAALAKDDDLKAEWIWRFERNNGYITELKQQMLEQNEWKNRALEAQVEEDKKNHNLLIDDAWREPHRRLLRDHYKDNLEKQMEDKNVAKQQANDNKKADDKNYKDELARLKALDDKTKKQIEAERKNIINKELADQLDEKAQIKQIEKQIKDLENENHKRKIQHDNDVYLDNLFRKKQLENEVLNKIGDQINQNDLKRKLANEEAKKPGLTSVPIPPKLEKNYNCKVCSHSYPLKFMNRKKK